MNWKHRMRRHLLFALFGAVAATAFYWGLGYTTGLHGFAVKALGPAISLRLNLDPNCYARPYCYLEELAVNAVLYTFWILIALIGIDAIRQLTRKSLP
jgi:hypothetical protein